MRLIAFVTVLFVPGIVGSSWIPQSLVKDNIKGLTSAGEKGRELQDCPPLLDTESCDLPLDTPEKIQACAAECSKASCCEDDCDSCPSCASYIPCLSLPDPPTDDPDTTEDSCPPELDAGSCDLPLDTPEKLQACATECSKATCCQDACGSCPSCTSYIPCLSLPDPPTDDPDTPQGNCKILTVDYYNGFNLHFSINKRQAESVMPYSCFSPLRLPVDTSLRGNGISRKARNLNSVTERNLTGDQSRGHYISLYVATIGVEFEGTEVRVGRADLFTYAIDPYGEKSLVFIAAYSEVPTIFQQDEALLQQYKQTVTNLALDSTTGKTSYPHYFAYDFLISENGFRIGGGDVGEEKIEIKIDENCDGQNTDFTRDFVLANSLAYRSTIDKNVNYFNQDFIGANVKSFPVNNVCLPTKNIQPLLDMLPTNAKLESLQAYGSSDKAITWQYEDSTISMGTPYFTLDEKNERIVFKQQAFSDIMTQKAGKIADSAAEALFKLTTLEDNVYINWELSDAGVDALSDELNLSSLGLTMVPIKIVAGEKPKYILTLNAYVSVFDFIPGDDGAGVRFEYSIYVKKQGSSRPFFMVIEALSSIDTFDPVEGSVPATTVTHSRTSNIISISSSTWEANIRLFRENKPLSVEKEWITANDEIFWLSGVSDQVFYDKSYTLQQPLKANIKSSSGSFTFAPFVKDVENPAHIFVYKEPIDFVVIPWSNLETLPNPPVWLPALKSQIYSGVASLSAALIASGQQEPLFDAFVYGKFPDNPRLHLNYEIPEHKISDLEKLIGLRDEYHIVPMAMTDKSEPRYMMSVGLITNVTSVYDGSSFKQVAWSVYIKDNSGHIYLYEFHKEQTAAGLNIEESPPIRLPPETFTVSNNKKKIEAIVKSGSIEYSIIASLKTGAVYVGLKDEWVHAHGRVYGKKGIYHNLYYNGQLWNAAVIPVQSSRVKSKIIAPWSEFVNEKPFEVFYFDADILDISNPWYNIEEI